MRPSCREASGVSEMTDERALRRLQAIQAGTHENGTRQPRRDGDGSL